MRDEDVQKLIDKIMDILSWNISDFKCHRQEIYKVICEELSVYPGKLDEVNPRQFAMHIKEKVRGRF